MRSFIASVEVETMWQGYGAGRSALCCGAGTGGCETAPWDDAVLSSLIWVHQLDHWSLWMLAGSALLMDFAHDRLCPHCCKPLWQATRPWVGACLLPTMGHCNSETEGPVLGTHRWDTWGPSPAFKRSVCTGVKIAAIYEGLVTLGCSHSSSPMAEGGATCASHLRDPTDWRGARVTMWICFVLSSLCFSCKCFKTELLRAKAVLQHGMKFVGGFVWLFWKGKTSKHPFSTSEQTEMFSCSSYWSHEKTQPLPEPSPVASSPSWQAQACCFTNLPACPVMVVSYGRLSSCKGIAAVLIMFLVALFQRPPALQIGLEDCWSVAYSEAGWLCPVVQMWLLQRLSRAGRAGQSDPELAVPSRGTWRGYPKLTSLGVCLMCNG